MKIKLSVNLPFEKEFGATRGREFVVTKETNDYYEFIGDNGKQCQAFEGECEVIDNSPIKTEASFQTNEIDKSLPVTLDINHCVVKKDDLEFLIKKILYNLSDDYNMSDIIEKPIYKKLADISDGAGLSISYITRSVAISDL